MAPMRLLCCATRVSPGSKSSARCCLGTSQQLYQRWRVSPADPIAKIRWKSKLRCFSNYHANWKMCAPQLCEKLQKVPLPALGQVTAPLGSLCPVLCTRPPTHAIDDHVHCTVIALSGNIVAELFVLRGQPWLDAIPFGCWCHSWSVASFHLSEKDIVAFPRPRLSQLVPAHGLEIVLKLITSNDPPPANIRVVIGKAAATSAAYRPQPSTSPLYDFCELQTLMLRNLDQVQLRDVDLRCPDSPSTSGNASMRCWDAT